MARRRANNKPKPDFHRQTVLFQWALAKFGVQDLKQFTDRFQIGPREPWELSIETHAEGKETRFLQSILNNLPATTGAIVSPQRLCEYDQNIIEHTQAINTARHRHSQSLVDWKYHQYLALLFTEMFLDRYFDDPEALRDEINEQIAQHNARVHEVDRVEPFPTEPRGDDPAIAREQLSRLAFWCATGSGKTLLMHMHVRQFRWYHERAYQAGKWPRLDQIILVTPNEGLSRQHKDELTESGFDVVTVGEQGIDGLFAAHAQRAIKIVDIHKFREDHGKATVATEAFEGCNLVLVDEGHRGAGAGGDGAWFSRRDQLARGGFTFEYSATFKEAIGNDEVMRHRYARSILFDYAYRNFYRDGYGKDFMILNLEDDEKQKHYLTAALLLFYQQLKVWADGGEAIKPFRIDKPLWVFVGHTVTGGKVSSVDDKFSVSDVVEVLLFLKGFLAEPGESVALIQSLLEQGYTDHQGRNLLANRLMHLEVPGDKAALARTLHEGILRDVFNAPGGGALAVQLLKGAAGELALKVGEAEPFGVVNVGDPVAVAEKCADCGITRLEDDLHRESLFHGINRDDSPINLLVGSRKFTEGWNSWRVSSIGLMRMGKNEGTQIIQLFGRGVRLRGYQMSLRRSMVLTNKPNPPKNLRLVETLQVFGVKASYMNTFRDWILSEVPEAAERQVWDLPTVKKTSWPKLKTLRLKEVIDGVRVEGGQAFRMLGPLVKLRPPHKTAPEDTWLRRHPTRLNWMPRIQGITGQNRQVTSAIGDVAELPRQRLNTIPRLFFDVDELLFGLEAFKATRGLDRLYVDRAAIHKLLDDPDWYVLHAPAADMRLDRYENRVQWQRMAQQLLNAYAERFYRFVRGMWEASYIEVVELAENDPSVLDSYSIETTDAVQSAEQIAEIAAFVQELREAIGTCPLAERSQFGLKTVPFSGHLYQPLLHIGQGTEVRISPVALNKGEAQFVVDLAKWCNNHDDIEVFLLRNQAVVGLGFFQAANFFPDFLLWVKENRYQHLAFIDPKGLHHYDSSDPKVRFATRDLPRLQQIVKQQDPELVLHAFILSNTPYSELRWSKGTGDLMTADEVKQLGVLFQDEDTAYIKTLFDLMHAQKVAQ